MVQFDYDEVIKNLGVLAQKAQAGLLMYAQTEASKLESYMKINRPWTDRTSMAKNTLISFSSMSSQMVLKL